MDSSVSLTRNDPRDIGLICLVKKRKIRFRILSDLKIQSWIFLKKRTLSSVNKMFIIWQTQEQFNLFHVIAVIGLY